MIRIKNISSSQKVARHCALECWNQRSGELSVSWMFDAWIFAMTYGIGRGFFGEPKIIVPTVDFIHRVGELVEPTKNIGINNFRKVPVIINGKVIVVTDFEENLNNLIKNGWFRENAEEFYSEFEDIHPFIDGNGRVGNILFNVLKGTLGDPVMPPVWKRRR
jgi:hypothetical protein